MKKLTFLLLIAVFFAACEKENIEPQVQNEDIQLKKGTKPEKVKIWHLKGNGEYVLIEVAPSAVDAHLAHGDMLYCEPDFYQGFEEDATGWLDGNSGWYGTVKRVASGENDIPSSTDSWHAIFEGDGSSAPFTRFDGYTYTFPDNGWTAEIDVYLDPNWAEGTGFDYTVASSKSDGSSHLRDFIFHVGATDIGLLVNGSNNSDFYANPYKLKNDNNGNYYEVTLAGWYTLKHHFYKDNGVLAVDLNLIDADGNILWTATLTNVTDIIPDVVGGNRYGWFTFISVDGGINVDEVKLYRGCAPM